jgi:hypothetical protein
MPGAPGTPVTVSGVSALLAMNPVVAPGLIESQRQFLQQVQQQQQAMALMPIPKLVTPTRVLVLKNMCAPPRAVPPKAAPD